MSNQPHRILNQNTVPLGQPIASTLVDNCHATMNARPSQHRSLASVFVHPSTKFSLVASECSKFAKFGDLYRFKPRYRKDFG